MSKFKILFSLITPLCQSLPARSILTFIELFFSAMMCTSGHITNAFVLMNLQKSWSTYYKFINSGKWDIDVVVKKFILTVTNFVAPFLKNNKIFIAIDDTICKTQQRRLCVWQVWVTAALNLFTKKGKSVSIPLDSELYDKSTKETKISLAIKLINTIKSSLSKTFNMTLLYAKVRELKLYLCSLSSATSMKKESL